MKKILLKLLSLATFLILISPLTASAHQPRIVSISPINVTDPEISKAYYGQLSGKPDIFIIKAEKNFSLYVNILVPDKAGQKKDVSVVITKDGQPLSNLSASGFNWKQMWEPFGQDSYWQGPEFKQQAEAGEYEITVTSAENNSKYSLAIGEAENFNFKEIVNALNLVPQLKRSFFNESPIGFILSPFGWSFILLMFVLAFIFGFLYRFILKKLAKGNVRGVSHNIGNKDKIFRLVLGLALLLWAITASWSPILLFFAGFCFFEAIFSWCGFYAAIGKNTCPI